MSKTLAQAVPPADPASQTLSLKTRIQDLPLSKQILLTSGFVFLMLLTLVIPDPVPFLDELLVGWLLFTGASATVGTPMPSRMELTIPISRAMITIFDTSQINKRNFFITFIIIAEILF